MRKLIRPAAVLLSVCMLFSLSGCFRKRIEEVDADDFVDACEDILELEEFDQERFRKDYENYRYYYICHNYPGYYEVEVEYNKVNVPEDADGSERLYVRYCLMDDGDDAEAQFEKAYDRVSDAPDNMFVILMDRYVEGEYGYIIYAKENSNGEYTSYAYYYAEDMYIQMMGYSEEGYDRTEAFLEELGLPFKHK